MNAGNLKQIQLSFLDRNANAKPVAAPSKPVATVSSSADYPTTTKRTKKGKQSATKVISIKYFSDQIAINRCCELFTF